VSGQEKETIPEEWLDKFIREMIEGDEALKTASERFKITKSLEEALDFAVSRLDKYTAVMISGFPREVIVVRLWVVEARRTSGEEVVRSNRDIGYYVVYRDGMPWEPYESFFVASREELVERLKGLLEKLFKEDLEKGEFVGIDGRNYTSVEFSGDGYVVLMALARPHAKTWFMYIW
jgi:hypothetical protein